MVKIRIGIEKRVPGPRRWESKNISAEFESEPTSEMIRNHVRDKYPGWTIQGWAVDVMRKYRVLLTETVVRRRTFTKESSMTAQELEDRFRGLLNGDITAGAYFGGTVDLLYQPKLDVSVLPILEEP